MVKFQLFDSKNLINLSFILFFLSCKIILSQSLQIKFYNETNADLDSLVINNEYIGHIATNSSSDFTDFKALVFHNYSPEFFIAAYRENKLFLPFKKYEPICGMMDNKIVEKGKYEYDIFFWKLNCDEALMIRNHMK